VTYSTLRPHQSIGERPPAERFALRLEEAVEVIDTDLGDAGEEDPGPPAVTRRVGTDGRIRLEGFSYTTGRWLAGEVVEVAFSGALLEISHRGEVVATHARQRRPGKASTRAVEPRADDAARSDRRHERGPSVRHLGVSQLCRLELSSRQPLEGPLSRGRHRRPIGPDLLRRCRREDPPDPSRPLKGVWCLLDAERPSAQPKGQPHRGHGLDVSCRYRIQTVTRVPGLDSAGCDGRSIRQRGRASWELIAYIGFDAEARKRRYTRKTFRGSRREAERELAGFVAEVTDGGRVPTGLVSLGHPRVSDTDMIRCRHATSSNEIA
jgi:hypothetical protein